MRVTIQTYIFEVGANATEGTVDRLVLLTIETFHQLLHLGGSLIEFVHSLEKGFTLLAEVDILVVSLLVDMRILLELLVDLVQLTHQSRNRQAGEALQSRRRWKRSKLLDLAHVELTLGDRHGALAAQSSVKTS